MAQYVDIIVEVIQNNQPLFMLTWVGSIVSLLSTILFYIVSVGLSEAWLIVLIGAVYMLGVQDITIAVHIPLTQPSSKSENQRVA